MLYVFCSRKRNLSLHEKTFVAARKEISRCKEKELVQQRKLFHAARKKVFVARNSLGIIYNYVRDVHLSQQKVTAQPGWTVRVRLKNIQLSQA